MPSTSLAGRSILIVEDEPLIALEIVTAFQNAGAVALTARSLTDAIHLIEHDGLSAAVLDFGLADGDADAVCARLGRASHPLHPTQRIHPSRASLRPGDRDSQACPS